MGVTGLWRLLEPAGKPVPLETLENKILAVDISIWLHQMVKGFQDPRGGAVTNAHLLGLFQRLCKLLYYRIKPVFVFDGGVPTLKRLTIVKRQSKKSEMHNTVDQMRKQLLGIVTKQMAVNKVMSEKAKSPKKKSPIKSIIAGTDDENLFKLPPMVEESTAASDDESDSDESAASSRSRIDLHSLDVNSAYFKSLTPRERHDLLTELKETRKQNSWGRINELPAQSDNFSDYQMKRLLKRRQVQVSLEETEKEMGGDYLSLNELEILLNEEGIDTKIDSIPSRRIASDEKSHFVLIKDVKEALETAAKRQAAEESEKNTPSTSKENDLTIELGDEFDEDLEAAIKLSLQCTDDNKPSPSSSKDSNLIDLTFLGPDFIETDSEWSTDEESENNANSLANTDLSLAKAYMLENSGLSEYEIMRIINSRCQGKKCKTKKMKKAKQCPYLNTNTVSGNGIAPEGSLKTELDNTLTTNKDSVEIDFGKNDITPVNINDIKQEADLDNSTESCQILISSKQQTQREHPFSSSSDSDDNFEEVPEIIAPSILLTLKTDPIIDDDIFSDIFQIDATKVADQKDTVTKIKANVVPDEFPLPLLEVAEDHFKTKPLSIDDMLSGSIKNEKNEKTTDNPPKIGKQGTISDEVIKERIVKEKTFNKIVLNLKETCRINIDKTNISSNNVITGSELECTPDKDTSSSGNVSKSQNTAQRNLSPSRESQTSVLLMSPESSPQKGMTLNEIRHMITKESVIGEEDSMEKQMISTEELSIFADDLEVERDKIEKQQSKLDRMGRNISEEMTKDAQDLLKMFGIPYIVAPMEAEAQCAFLESINLTNGTITDDSDIWLFGGKSVYKNFFNQQKYVLQFLSENIQSCFKLSREQLILLALLVGSDYTTGVNGVGPVTAMEILAAFPSAAVDLNPPYATLLASLRRFRSWWSNNRASGNVSLRNKLKNISLSQEFPSHRVVEAYLSPSVDKNSEAFSWGKPDVTALREFARAKFGWSQSKTDEVLKPVMKRLDEKVCQQSIRSFFRTEITRSSAEDNMSKRVKKAVERMGGSIVEDDSDRGPSKTKKPRKQITPVKTKVTKNSDSTENTNSVVPSDKEKIIPLASPVASATGNTKKDRISKRPFVPERYQEVIPQRESDKSKLMNTKLKAIELFKTSKRRPGSSKKRKIAKRAPKADAELSESSSD